jgi:hypothetical protein
MLLAKENGPEATDLSFAIIRLGRGKVVPKLNKELPV